VTPPKAQKAQIMKTLLTTTLLLLIAATASAQAAKPIVYVLSTGGTIAGSGSSSTDLSNYKPGAILGEQLVKAVPQIAQIADVRVEQIVNVNSSDITIENWLTLAKRIHESGFEGKPILTMFDYIDFDEGRDPVTSPPWKA